MAAMRAAILFAGALLCASCASYGGPVARGAATPPPVSAAAIAPREAELRIDIVELTCHSCAGQVALGTSRIPGVRHVSAEMLEHILVVRYDPTQLTEPALIAAIDKVVDALAD
jgi:hypothetical protein